MNDKRQVAVIAGTPVDTQMGAEYIERKTREAGLVPGFMPLNCPASADCDEQVRFQYSDNDGKRAVMDNIFDPDIDPLVSSIRITGNLLAP